MHNTLALPTRKKRKAEFISIPNIRNNIRRKKDAKEFYRLAKSFQSIKLP